MGMNAGAATMRNDANIREVIAEIGGPTPLVGVLTEAAKQSRGETALILLNSGIMHRVGACRLSVKVARSVAAQTGLPCLRFDFSGVGDSAPRRAGGLGFDEAAVAEVVEAMDYLERSRGIHQFIIYGLCSGARIACTTAERDQRVIAVVQLDGFCYPTARALLQHCWSRLCSLRAWQGRFNRWFGRKDDDAEHGSVLTGARKDFEVPQFAEDPGRDVIATQLQNMMDSQVKLYCIFTGRDPYFCYRDQFRDCFRDVHFGPGLSVDYFPNASHIFTEPVYQKAMVDGVANWVAGLDAVKKERQKAHTASTFPPLKEAFS
jgi:dienelactone hydrolase